MPGFRHCSWCYGKGCVACDREQAKWEKAEAERKEKHAARSIDEVRQSLIDLQWMRDGGPPHCVSPGAQLAVGMNDRQNLDIEAIGALIAAEQAVLDAEYARQFPNGPQPIFVAHSNNPQEMATLKQVFHRESLESTFGPNGRGMAEIEEKLAEAKAALAAQGASTS